MYSYAAILGHQPKISLAELAASVPGFELESVTDKHVALFFASQELKTGFIDKLGGTIVLAERITEADVSMEDVPKLLSGEVTKVKKKVTFGLRCFRIPKADIKNAYRRGKEEMKRQGRPCRYIGNEKKSAAAALLKDSGVVTGKKGVELFIIGRGKGLWVGKTIGVQDIDAYTWRDMEKPVRDTTVGLLPPKLAQILLNFGEWTVLKKKKTYTVLDPFCGTGVIPMESLLRGWHVLASDSAQKAVNGCTKNLEWLRKEKKIYKKDVSDTVAKHDAVKPFVFKTLPDMVVTETTLGPPVAKKLTKTDAKKFRKDNEALQAAFLQNAAETLPGVPIVCTWPFWKVGNELFRLEKIWEALDKAGYSAVLPEGIEPEDPEKPSLLYHRKDQFVGREIVVLIQKGLGVSS